jgi:hypothetical protein
MDVLAKQEFIRQKATQHNIKWSRHALTKLASETVSVVDLEIALRQAKVIEDILIFNVTCPIAWF